MRTLILTCNTGEGHNSTAAALKEYFVSKGTEADIFDSLSLIPPATAKVIEKGHVFLYRKAPRLFGAGYRFEENHKGSLVYKIFAKYSDAMYDVIKKGNYDVVLSVHVFPALMLTNIADKLKNKVTTAFVCTDYTCSPGVSLSALDLYFIPHKKLIREFESNGIDIKKIIPSGIPVNMAFLKSTDKANARNELSLPNGKMILVSCGSMGCGPIEEIVQTFTNTLERDQFAVIICGSNKKLYSRLSSSNIDGKIYVYGYVNRMNLFMDSADVYLTKAGGLSTTEAIMKRLPIIYINAVPGCETRNIEFMTKNNYALSSDSAAEAAGIAQGIISSEEVILKYKTAFKSDFDQNACEVIFNTIMNLGKEEI